MVAQVPPLPTANVPVVAVMAIVPPLLLAACAWLALPQLVDPMVGEAVHAGNPEASSSTLLSVALARLDSTVELEAYRMSPVA